MMKHLYYIPIILLLFSCKSTKEVKKNQLDISSVKTANTENLVNLSTTDYLENEIIIHPADFTKPTIITDKNGNTQRFDNVKKITLKNKSEQKKDSTVAQKKNTADIFKDKSKIDEKTESVSSAKNFKGIFFYGALSLFFVLVIYLVYKFKK